MTKKVEGLSSRDLPPINVILRPPEDLAVLPSEKGFANIGLHFILWVVYQRSPVFVILRPTKDLAVLPSEERCANLGLRSNNVVFPRLALI
jgi:hypothetical protein